MRVRELAQYRTPRQRHSYMRADSARPLRPTRRPSGRDPDVIACRLPRCRSAAILKDFDCADEQVGEISGGDSGVALEI